MTEGQNGKICYIVGAGEFGDGLIIPEEGDLVIAGDGGFRYCQEKNIPVDLVIGDFDSLGHCPEHPNVKQLPAEKDDTDMRAAMEEGWRRGYREFHLYGGTGGRISHTIANIQLLTELAGRGGHGVLVGNGSWYRVIQNDRYVFGAEQSGCLSVFCLGERAEGVWERGLKYELTNATLTKEYPVGVSNEFTGQAGYVSVEKGTLLLIREVHV